MLSVSLNKAFPSFLSAGELAAYCMGPNKAAYCELEDNHDGTYRLSVKPQETGRHILQVKYGGEHVQGEYSHRSSTEGSTCKVSTAHRSSTEGSTCKVSTATGQVRRGARAR